MNALLIGSIKAEEAKPNLPIADGHFKPDMDSLKQYQCPDWFRDAKFGIWAHWGPQAVPMDGDWYARGMYEQGGRQYQHHLANYGHPSTNGYKDIIPLWKAEKWDPDRLMSLYQKAGATSSAEVNEHSWGSRLPVLAWVLTLLLIGLLALPLTLAAFGRLADRGYSFGKAAGLLLVAWGAWMVSSIRLAPFTFWAILVVMLLLGIASALIAWKRWDSIPRTAPATQRPA